MAVNIGLAVYLGSRILPRVGALDWTILASAGTIGALFGTPVAAALIFSQTLTSNDDAPLWDKLFCSIDGRGSRRADDQPVFPSPFLPLSAPLRRDADSGYFQRRHRRRDSIALGMVAVWCLPRLHRLMHKLKHPVLILGTGGLILGILGSIGGTVTLFKGLDEMQQLAFSQVFSVSDYLLFAVIKLAALVVAAACGFRGGRIFPAVFVGVALGLMLHEHVDAVPAAITVSCSILGLVLVVTRDAWLSLFMAAVVVPDSTLFPLLCIVMLPAWLLLAGKPMMMAWRNDK